MKIRLQQFAFSGFQRLWAVSLFLVACAPGLQVSRTLTFDNASVLHGATTDPDVLTYYEDGTGLPILFLSDPLDSPEMWRPVASRLADKHHVFILEGVQETDHAQGLEAQARSGLRVLDRLGLSQAVIVGHGLAAWQAAASAVLAPDRVIAAILVNPDCPAARTPQADLWLAKAWDLSASARFEPQAWREWLAEAEDVLLPASSDRFPNYFFDLGKRWLHTGLRERIHRALDAASADPLLELVRLAASPNSFVTESPGRPKLLRFHVLRGAQDSFCRALEPPGPKELVGFSWTESAAWPNRGHLLPLDVPEDLASEIQRFIAGQPSNPVEAISTVSVARKVLVEGQSPVRLHDLAAAPAAQLAAWLADPRLPAALRRNAAAKLELADPRARHQLLVRMICAGSPSEWAMAGQILSEGSSLDNEKIVGCLSAAWPTASIGQRLWLLEVAGQSLRDPQPSAAIISWLFAATHASQPLVRRQAAWALGSTGRMQPDRPEFQDLLADPSAAVRATFARSLARAEPGAQRMALVKALLSRLVDPDESESVVLAARAALRRLAARRNAEARVLVEQANKTDLGPAQKVHILEVLAGIDVEAIVPDLAALLDNEVEPVSVRTAAALALGAYPHRLAFNAIEHHLTDHAPTVRSAVWQALAETIGRAPEADRPFLHLDRFVAPASEFLSSGSATERCCAARVLFALQSVATVHWPAKALRDRDPLVRTWAARALGKQGGTGAEALRAAAAHDDDPWVRATAWSAFLQMLGQPVHSLLTGAMMPGLPLADPAALDQALHDPVAMVRAAALMALQPSLLTDKTAFLPAVRSALRDPQPEVRQHAIDALVRLQGDECAAWTKDLQPLLADPVAPVRHRVLDHLRRTSCTTLDAAAAWSQVSSAAKNSAGPALRGLCHLFAQRPKFAAGLPCPTLLPGLNSAEAALQAACLPVVVAACPMDVKALSRHWLNDPSALVRSAAWRILPLPSSEETDRWHRGLADEHWHVRLHVVQRAETLPSSAALEWLTPRLHDDSADVVDAALSSLLMAAGPAASASTCKAIEDGRISADRVAQFVALARNRQPNLIPALLNQCPAGLTQALLERLAGLDLPGLDALALHCLTAPNPAWRLAGLQHWLELRGRGLPIAVLRPLTVDPDAKVRARAVELVGLVNMPDVRDLLDRALSDDDIAVRGAALKALNQQADRFGKTLGPTLLKQLRREPKPSMRVLLLAQIAHQADPEVITSAVQCGLQDGDTDVRVRASVLLQWASPEILMPFLVQRLNQDPSPIVRGNLLTAFSAEHAPPPDQIRARLADDDPEVRSQAVQLLAILDDKASAPALAELLQHDTAADVRAAAAESLGALAPQRGAALLPKALVDPQPVVRLSVLKVWRRCVSPDHDDALRALLDGEPDSQVRQAIQELLRPAEPR